MTTSTLIAHELSSSFEQKVDLDEDMSSAGSAQPAPSAAFGVNPAVATASQRQRSPLPRSGANIHGFAFDSSSSSSSSSSSASASSHTHPPSWSGSLEDAHKSVQHFKRVADNNKAELAKASQQTLKLLLDLDEEKKRCAALERQLAEAKQVVVFGGAPPLPKAEAGLRTYNSCLSTLLNDYQTLNLDSCPAMFNPNFVVNKTAHTGRGLEALGDSLNVKIRDHRRLIEIALRALRNVIREATPLYQQKYDYLVYSDNVKLDDARQAAGAVKRANTKRKAIEDAADEEVAEAQAKKQQTQARRPVD